MKKEEQIKDLIKQITTSSSQKELGDNILVQNKLRDIWDTTPTTTNPNVESEKEEIWNGISKRIQKNPVNRRLQLFAYAASVAIFILACSVSYLMLKEDELQIMNVYKVGHQTTDTTILPDGTVVVLGAESRISYPSHFAEDARVVELSGQAFFYVNKSEDHPFIVKTNKIDISVLGTEFEVFSYESDEVAEVTLLSGKVEVLNNRASKNKQTLAPNQRMTIDSNSRITIDSIDADKYTMWRDKKTISFSNERLEDILPRLEKWYGRTIKCDNKIAHQYRFTFTLYDESLKDLLNVLVFSSELKYEENESGYIITN